MIASCQNISSRLKLLVAVAVVEVVASVLIPSALITCWNRTIENSSGQSPSITVKERGRISMDDGTRSRG